MQPQNLSLEQPLKNQITVGSIEIRVISKPKVRLEQLEGILKLKSKQKSTELVRELRQKDHEREERRLGSN